MTDFDKISECVKNFRDSLLRALGAPPYVARPLPGAPLAATSRPEWVRLCPDRFPDPAPRVRKVLRWTPQECPVVEHDNLYRFTALQPGEWEPCAAPSAAKGRDTGTADAMPGVSPAATPAAYVPQVGDFVTWGACELVYRVETVTATSAYVRCCDRRGSTDLTEIELDDPHGLRRATSSERAAAGLPVDEAKESATKPVDREGLAGAIWRSFNDESPDRRFDTIGVYERESYIRAADAAIAFMAKGGAS